MRNNRAILLAFLCLFILLSIEGTGKTLKTQKDKSVYFYAIDGFEKPGEWVVNFSQFRAAKCGNPQGSKNRVEFSKEWYGWFAADDKNIKKKEILPTFVQRNASLLKDEKTILGIKACWDVAGYNSITIVPNNNFENKDKDNVRYSSNKSGRYPNEPSGRNEFDRPELISYDSGSYVLIPAFTTELSLFAWISNYNQYKLAFHIEDYKGVLHTLSPGYIKSDGWHKMRLKLPSYLTKTKRPLKLKRIKLISNPQQNVAIDTYIYLDLIQGKSVITDPRAFGKELSKPDYLWKYRVGN